MEITPTLHIPDDELDFSFARSGGPGGQNVNKVESKAIMRWSLTANTSISADVKQRLRTQQRRRITTEDVLVLHGQRYRDQAKNIDDCREKLKAMLLEALTVPKPRKATRPSRGAKRRRLEDKRQQGARKAARQRPSLDD